MHALMTNHDFFLEKVSCQCFCTFLTSNPSQYYDTHIVQIVCSPVKFVVSFYGCTFMVWYNRCIRIGGFVG